MRDEAHDRAVLAGELGRLVEVLSGMTLDEFLRAEIFEPLGMAEGVRGDVGQKPPEGDGPDNDVAPSQDADDDLAIVQPALFLQTIGLSAMWRGSGLPIAATG
mgnify:CR=1 FL=1